jgi:hypothetical protein
MKVHSSIIILVLISFISSNKEACESVKPGTLMDCLSVQADENSVCCLKVTTEKNVETKLCSYEEVKYITTNRLIGALKKTSVTDCGHSRSIPKCGTNEIADYPEECFSEVDPFAASSQENILATVRDTRLLNLLTRLY